MAAKNLACLKEALLTYDPYKVWKENPPGPAHKELDRMFNSKEIDPSAMPDNVRQTNDMFKKFSAKVFAAHFRKTKAKFGLFAATGEGVSSQIPELGSSSVAPTQQLTSCEDKTEEMQLLNAPFCTWTYTDHTEKCDFVCVAVPITSGIRDIVPKLSEDGTQFVVRYTWPSTIYNAQELFNNKIKNRELI